MNKNQEKIGIERVNALSDGVIAIALTLLVIDIHVPETHNFDKHGLMSFLWEVAPDLLTYLSSFLVIAIYWILHHRVFNELKYITGKIMVFNVLFLFSISMIPFLSRIKMAYMYDPAVVGIISAVHTFTAVMLVMIWKHANKHQGLLKHSVSAKKRAYLTHKILHVPIVCVLTALVSVVDKHIGLYFFKLTPIIYLWMMRWDFDEEIEDTSQTT